MLPCVVALCRQRGPFRGKRGVKLRSVRGLAEQPMDPQFRSRYAMCYESS